MPKKPCKKDQIRNPDTGRCVKKTGRIGKAILDKKYTVCLPYKYRNKPEEYEGELSIEAGEY